MTTERRQDCSRLAFDKHKASNYLMSHDRVFMTAVEATFQDGARKFSSRSKTPNAKSQLVSSQEKDKVNYAHGYAQVAFTKGEAAVHLACVCNRALLLQPRQAVRAHSERAA